MPGAAACLTGVKAIIPRMKPRVKKILFTVFGIVLGIFILAVLFISPITKYVVEKYDEEYTGRQIKLDWAYVNPFTGYAYFRNLRMYESADAGDESMADSVFFESRGVGLDLSMLKLLSKTYEIKGLRLDHPKTTIIQYDNKNTFNFSDLIKKFSSDEPKDTTEEPVHFNLLDLEINEGEVHYREKVIPINYYIKELDFESGGYRWDVDTMTGKFSFAAGMGSGNIEADFMYNVANQDYRLSSVIKKLDMTIIEQYLRDLSHFGTVRAFLDAKIHATGNFKEATALDARDCRLELSDFHFGKNPKEDYASFERLLVDIIHLNPQDSIRDLDTVLLSRPTFVYEKYDELDNIQKMFGTKGSNVKEAKADPEHFNLILEIGKYVKEIVANFFQSYFKINRFEVSKADFRFADYSTSEKFMIALDPLTITSDSIDKRRNRASLALRSGIKPYGNATLDLKVNTKDSSDFDLSYNLTNIPLALFNPYFVTHTSFPMDRGTIEFNGNWRVRNAQLNSQNHLLVLDPRISNRVKRNDAKWLPLPLAMALVRERGNVIDYQIPITGNLRDPNFKIGDVVLDLLKNIFIKPPTIPYGIKVSEAERKIEKSLKFTWDMRGAGMSDEQKRFLDYIAEFLKDNKQAKIAVEPMQYAQKEKEHILLFEAKKKYYLSARKKDAASFTPGDSQEVARMSRRDPGFVKYLEGKTDKMLFTVHEKSRQIIPDSRVKTELASLYKLREANFMSFFKAKGVSDRVKLLPPKEIIPYNGFSYFQIEYDGEIPAELREGFEELQQLNHEYPRKKYFWQRRKLKDVFNASR